jgi:DNA-directed RNA polymerase specialized sigma24 family protein
MGARSESSPLQRKGPLHRVAYAGGVPEPDDFFAFAGAHACDLVKLGYALTGELAAAERLAEDALVAVFRSGPQTESAGDRSPPQGRDRLLTARRTLAARYRRRRRFSRPVLRRALELNDLRAADHNDVWARELDRDEALWEALDGLPASQRLVLGLRFGTCLSLRTTAQVLRRPVAQIARTQQRALNVLSLAADADVAGATPPNPESSPEADIACSVQEALHAHTPRTLDVQPLLLRLAERTSRQRHLPRRSAALGAAALLLLGGAVSTFLWVLLAGGSADDRSRPLAAEPPSPEGTQLVGFGSVAVLVPSGWGLHESVCGRTASDGTVYRDSRAGGHCTASLTTSSARFAAPPYNSPPLSVPAQRTGEVAGHVAQRTTVTRAEGVYRQTVFVFGAGFMMTVRSPDRSVVRSIVSSLRPVPEGYTVVPYCETLPVEQAAAALRAADLAISIAHTSSLSTRYGEPPVTFQNRAPGTVVPEGTSVALTIPSF